MTMETRTLSLLVVPKGEPTWSEMATEVRITDDAAGEFVKVIQSHKEAGEISIEPGEWPALREAIDNMVAECRGGKPSEVMA